jgi:hypothetical protein
LNKIPPPYPTPFSFVTPFFSTTAVGKASNKQPITAGFIATTVQVYLIKNFDWVKLSYPYEDRLN